MAGPSPRGSVRRRGIYGCLLWADGARRATASRVDAAVDPSATSELRDRGLLAYHLQDFAAALRDLEEYLRLSPRIERRSTEEPGEEREDIDSELWEHVKNLRKRVAGFN